MTIPAPIAKINLIKVGWDKVLKKFVFLEFKTSDPTESVKIGYSTGRNTITTPILVPYQLVGIYSSTLYNPYKGEGVLETLQFLFNTCSDEVDTEPDVLDYLMHRYIGVGDTTSINS